MTDSNPQLPANAHEIYARSRREGYVAAVLLLLVAHWGIPSALHKIALGSGCHALASSDASIVAWNMVYIPTLLLFFHPTYAKWRVRQAGFSQEKQTVERFENVGKQAMLALHDQPPFELNPALSEGKRAFKGFWWLFCCTILGISTFIFLPLSQHGSLEQMEIGLGAVLLDGLMLYVAYFSFNSRSDFRVDAARMEEFQGFLPHSTCWKDIATLIITTHYDVLRELSRTQLRFESSSSKPFLNLSLSSTPLKQRDLVTNFLRCVCSGQVPPLPDEEAPQSLKLSQRSKEPWRREYVPRSPRLVNKRARRWYL